MVLESSVARSFVAVLVGMLLGAAVLALAGCSYGYAEECQSPIAAVYNQMCNPNARKGGGA
jgi:hypothetical protein